MKTEELKRMIAEIAVENINRDFSTKVKSRIYFKNQMRSLMFGSFIKMNDHEALLSNGMARFLPDGAIPVILDDSEFIPKESDTKILVIEQIQQIKNF